MVVCHRLASRYGQYGFCSHTTDPRSDRLEHAVLRQSWVAWYPVLYRYHHMLDRFQYHLGEEAAIDGRYRTSPPYLWVLCLLGRSLGYGPALGYEEDMDSI